MRHVFLKNAMKYAAYLCDEIARTCMRKCSFSTTFPWQQAEMADLLWSKRNLFNFLLKYVTKMRGLWNHASPAYFARKSAIYAVKVQHIWKKKNAAPAWICRLWLIMRLCNRVSPPPHTHTHLSWEGFPRCTSRRPAVWLSSVRCSSTPASPLCRPAWTGLEEHTVRTTWAWVVRTPAQGWTRGVHGYTCNRLVNHNRLGKISKWKPKFTSSRFEE
jgi:hypothetical protein